MIATVMAALTGVHTGPNTAIPTAIPAKVREEKGKGEEQQQDAREVFTSSFCSVTVFLNKKFAYLLMCLFVLVV